MLLDFLILIAGLTILVAGGETLVTGATQLARNLGVSPLIIGLTVVAFGTSAPELAVSVGDVLSGGDEAGSLAIGNVVGSNIANILLALGLAAAAGGALVVARRSHVAWPETAVPGNSESASSRYSRLWSA